MVRTAVGLLVVTLAFGACTGSLESSTRPGNSAASSAHAHKHADGSQPVGDGTRASEVGYALKKVRLPRVPGRPGQLSFEIEHFDGAPVTQYLVDHTKELHLYLVRTDLAVFRHVHPVMDRSGRWKARVNVPEPGTYRVVAEFVAQDEGGRGDHVMLGRSVEVGGGWRPSTPDLGSAGDDGVVSVAVEGGPRMASDERLVLRVADVVGHPVTLDSYLAAQAHVVGFHEESGAAVRLHPVGGPVVEESGSVLTFDTELSQPGGYVLFVQVRVDDFLHTVPLRVEVAPSRTPGR
jgi:hypothetical protein